MDGVPLQQFDLGDGVKLKTHKNRGQAKHSSITIHPVGPDRKAYSTTTAPSNELKAKQGIHHSDPSISE